MHQTSRRDFIVKSLLATTTFSTGLPQLNSLAMAETNLYKSDHAAKLNNKANWKINIFSKHLQWLDYLQMAATAAEMGFDGIDLTVRPDGHVLPEKVADDLPKAVEIVKKAGLQVYMLTTAITDPNHPHTETILKTAGELGIGYYRTGWLNYQNTMSIPENLEDFKAKLKGLAVLNKKYNIHGDYQNHSGTSLGASIWDLWMVLKDVDAQWMGCQYDIRHATIEGAHSWPVALKLIQSHIRSIDIKDFHWVNKNGKWQVENVPLGSGMIDFKKYFTLLKQLNISVPVSLHYEYPLGGADSGAKKITMSKEEIVKAMKKDLATLKTWLKEAGLV